MICLERHFGGRADIRKVLEDDWHTLDAWSFAHPLEPFKYPTAALRSRVRVPYLSRQFVVGGVFVHIFNDDRSTRYIECLEFLLQLLQHLKDAFGVCGNPYCAAASPNAMWDSCPCVNGGHDRLVTPCVFIRPGTV